MDSNPVPTVHCGISDETTSPCFTAFFLCLHQREITKPHVILWSLPVGIAIEPHCSKAVKWLLLALRALLEAPCESITAVSLLWAQPRDVPMSHCVVAVLQPCRMETHTPQPNKETSSQIVLWMRPYNNNTATRSYCCPRTLSERAPSSLPDPQQRAIKSFWSIH